MNTKHWALFLVSILCSDYINGVTARVYPPCPNKPPCCKRPVIGCGGGGGGGGGSCTVKREAIRLLITSLQNAKKNIPNDCSFPSQTYQEYRLDQGATSGWQNLQFKSCRCVCGKGFVRLFVEVSFIKILISFVISLLDNLLGGLLGDVGSQLAQALGNVVNLVIRLLALDIIVRIVIIQRFIPGTKCKVESFEIVKITKITLLNLDLTFLAELLPGLLEAVLNLILRLIFNHQIKHYIIRELEKIRFEKYMFNCPY